MGLDMYLSATKHVGGYEFSDPDEKKLYSSLVKAFGMEAAADPSTPSADVAVTVGYWRKANAIHGWFINNCAEGVDDCRPVHVGRSDLETLRKDCLEVKRDPAMAEELLPVQEGFFFGGDTYDANYMADIDDTLEILDRALALGEGVGFEYRASW